MNCERTTEPMAMPRKDLPFCECRWLEEAAHDPYCPIEFDAEMNEYHLKTANGGSSVFYHCPFCSGRAPASLRGQMFATVTSEEMYRLHELTSKLKTESDVLARLGEPTHVFELGGSWSKPSADGGPDEIRTHKSVRYDNHSDTATINVNVGRHGNVSITFMGKQLRVRSANETSDTSEPRPEPLAITIERCTSVGQRGWLEFRQALWPHCPREEHAQEMELFLANPTRYAQWIAYSMEDKPVGFTEGSIRSDYVNGTESSPVGFLEGIYVKPDFRGQGVARSLIAEVARWVSAAGCRELASDALVENQVSHAMHRALGFTRTETVTFFRKVLNDGSMAL
jgi:aminoglycoside 6'-N-acetyltransferase I